jgi:acetylornithine/succinyldiaminopimelate/putrescine aminotransferase
MILDKLETFLVGTAENHPERSAATFERVAEVLAIVFGDGAQDMKERMKQRAGITNDRAGLSAREARILVEMLDREPVTRLQMQELYEHIRCSEIATDEAIEVHERYKIPVSHLEKDIIPVRGDGCWVMDTKGRWYLDMDSNYSATNLGMENEEVAQGLYNQARLLISMKEDRVQIARTRFLREIMPMMPEGLHHFYWQNSGGEAVDKALKIAKAYTSTTDVVAFEKGFHGRTHGAVAVTHNERYRTPFGLDAVNWVHFAPFNDIDAVKKIVDGTGAKIVILEIVQGEEAGNRPARPDFVAELWNFMHERGGVIIDDEVQAGFGRTALKKGDWFACMGYGVVPDIMVIGKSFGGGYPVTAVVTRGAIAQAMQPGYDGSTFGGTPMAMTAALIATRQMRRKNITENVVQRSAQFKKGMKTLKTRHPVIGEVRVHGLMIAVSVKTPENVVRLQEYLKDLGVKSSLSTGAFIRFLPPTVIGEGEIDFLLERLDAALDRLER